jgi:CPA2 family monovalent cation:H+ antiporter-2
MVAVPVDIFKDVLILLGATGIVIPLFQRQRISPIVGFILVGIAVGPSGLGALTHFWPPLSVVTIEDPAAIGPLAELGVVFLMFMIGLELSWERLNTTRRLVFGLGLAQVAISAIVIAALLIAIGLDRSASIAIGLALAMSSTAVIVQVLVGENRLASMAGRVSFAVLLFQDLAVVPILFALNFSGVDPGDGGLATADPTLLQVGEAVLSALAAVVFILVLGRRALRPLFHSVARSGTPESFMAMSLLVVLATGLITAYAGLSMALGALIAGLLLAETEYRRQIEVTIEPFKGLFLGVFLIAIGMSLDLGYLVREPVLILGLCLGLLAIKLGLIIGLSRVFGLSWNVGLQAGLLLAPGGEFGFVILEVARDHSLINQSQAETALLVATITLALIPLLSRLGRRLSPYVARTKILDAALTTVPKGDEPRVVLAGFGRVGRMVGDMLDVHKVPYIALDSDADRVAKERSRGRPVFFGDMTRLDILAKLDLDRARALVITVDDNQVVDRLVAAARAIRHDLVITARARDARHAAQLYRLGASDAVPETVEASLQLSEAVLVDIGTPMGLVIASIHEKRALIQQETKAMAPDARQRTRNRRRPITRLDP